MKLYTSIGLGEIVIIKGAGETPSPRSQKISSTDEIGKVIAVLFELGQMPKYHVKYRNTTTGQDVFLLCSGHELIGDPDFNHDTMIAENGYAHLEEDKE